MVLTLDIVPYSRLICAKAQSSKPTSYSIGCLSAGWVGYQIDEMINKVGPTLFN